MNRAYVVLAGIFFMVVLVVAGWWAWSWATGGHTEVAQASPGSEGVVGGDCTFTKAKFKTSDTLRTTNMTSFVEIPDMKQSFTVSGTTATCLEVEFSAEVTTGPILLVRALLDGSVVAQPGPVQFSANQTGLFHHLAFHFAFTNVAPGAHTVKMQWAVNPSGDVYMNKRSLFVHYR